MRLYRCGWFFTILLAGAITASAQPAPVADCPSRDPGFFESAEYSLAEDAEFHGGFSFLRSLHSIAADSLPQKGPFRWQDALAYKDKLQAWLDSSTPEQQFHIRYIEVYLDRCDPAKRELHLNYRVFDSNPALPVFRLFESRQQESTDPIGATGSVAVKSPVQFEPQVGYNSSDRVFWGGKLSVQGSVGIFDKFVAEGLGSKTGNRTSVGMTGERSWETGFLQSAVWRLGYTRSDRPTDSGSLIQGGVAAGIALRSNPLGKSGAVFRFASSVTGGNAQSELPQQSLPADSLASSPNQTWKSAAGITTRQGPHSVAVSYGLQLGRTGNQRTIDYDKHIIDAVFSTYKLVGDHKLIEYETGFTFGALRVPGVVPAVERFFGGNRENGFFDGTAASEDWQIRGNPFIRGIPANDLSRVVPGPATGGEGFFSWNNTVALPSPFFREPLLPKELTESQEFNDQLETQKSANLSALIVAYTAEDPVHKRAAEQIPEVDAGLMRLRVVIEGIAAADSSAKPVADPCLRVIRDKRAVLDEAAEAMEVVVEDDGVINASLECAARVQAVHGGTDLAAPVQALVDLRTKIVAMLASIDTPSIKRRADADMAVANRVMDVFFKEANLISINPVFVFDVARLSGPVRSPNSLGVRYSVGGGARLSFARLLNLTVGYAANVRRQSFEKAGDYFISMDILDLFR